MWIVADMCAMVWSERDRRGEYGSTTKGVRPLEINGFGSHTEFATDFSLTR